MIQMLVRLSCTIFLSTGILVNQVQLPVQEWLTNRSNWASSSLFLTNIALELHSSPHVEAVLKRRLISICGLNSSVSHSQDVASEMGRIFNWDDRVGALEGVDIEFGDVFWRDALRTLLVSSPFVILNTISEQHLLELKTRIMSPLFFGSLRAQVFPKQFRGPEGSLVTTGARLDNITGRLGATARFWPDVNKLYWLEARPSLVIYKNNLKNGQGEVIFGVDCDFLLSDVGTKAIIMSYTFKNVETHSFGALSGSAGEKGGR